VGSAAVAAGIAATAVAASAVRTVGKLIQNPPPGGNRTTALSMPGGELPLRKAYRSAQRIGSFQPRSAQPFSPTRILLRNLRQTERGAHQFLIRMAVRPRLASYLTLSAVSDDLKFDACMVRRLGEPHRGRYLVITNRE
jgi:hypothetical protein